MVAEVTWLMSSLSVTETPIFFLPVLVWLLWLHFLNCLFSLIKKVNVLFETYIFLSPSNILSHIAFNLNTAWERFRRSLREVPLELEHTYIFVKMQIHFLSLFSWVYWLTLVHKTTLISHAQLNKIPVHCIMLLSPQAKYLFVSISSHFAHIHLAPDPFPSGCHTLLSVSIYYV